MHPQDFKEIPVIVDGDDSVFHQFSIGGWTAGERIGAAKPDYAKMERKASAFGN
jgi:hypothetical protein